MRKLNCKNLDGVLFIQKHILTTEKEYVVRFYFNLSHCDRSQLTSQDRGWNYGTFATVDCTL